VWKYPGGKQEWADAGLPLDRSVPAGDPESLIVD